MHSFLDQLCWQAPFMSANGTELTGCLLHSRPDILTTPPCAARKELLSAAGKAHMDLLEAARKLYLKARAVTLAQRAKLYALDELEQSTMRLR